MIAKEEQTTKQFALNDPYLPLIISGAAIEFDKLSRGEEVDFVDANKLACFLSEALESEDKFDDAIYIKGFDPNVLSVIGKAFNAVSKTGKTDTVKDILENSLKMVSEMRSGKATDYDFLRDFCVAFGEALLSYRSSFNTYRPINRFRKYAS